MKISKLLLALVLLYSFVSFAKMFSAPVPSGKRKAAKENHLSPGTYQLNWNGDKWTVTLGKNGSYYAKSGSSCYEGTYSYCYKTRSAYFQERYVSDPPSEQWVSWEMRNMHKVNLGAITSYCNSEVKANWEKISDKTKNDNDL
jgi:hypothetical protein